MRLLPPLSLLAATQLGALNIEISYEYDSDNFFNTAERRNALESVAEFYGNLLQDNLLQIDNTEFFTPTNTNATWFAVFSNPTTGEQVRLEDLVVPEDTIIIYAGSQQLGSFTRGRGGAGSLSVPPGNYPSGWIPRVLGRGQAGAEESQPGDRTDIGLWGGTVTFDNDTNWNFSLEENQSGTEFLKIALHEMGHVLGLGPSNPWRNLIADGTFNGAAATASNGGTPPTADTGHFLNDLNSPLYGSFGTTHGNVRPALMLASFLDTGSNFDVATDLDLAGLVDIGWEVVPPTQLNTPALSPEGVTLNWPTSSFCNYEVIRSTDLLNPNGGSGPLTGDGSIQSYSDPSPEALKAFYQLKVTSTAVTGKSKATSQKSKSSAVEHTEGIETKEHFATGCYCEH